MRWLRIRRVAGGISNTLTSKDQKSSVIKKWPPTYFDETTYTGAHQHAKGDGGVSLSKHPIVWLLEPQKVQGHQKMTSLDFDETRYIGAFSCAGYESEEWLAAHSILWPLESKILVQGHQKVTSPPPSFFFTKCFSMFQKIKKWLAAHPILKSKCESNIGDLEGSSHELTLSQKRNSTQIVVL